MRRSRDWIEHIAAFGIVVLVMFTAFPAAIYVHGNASQWEVLGIFVSFGLGLVPAVWYFRTKRSGWLAGILSAVLLGFSFVSALFHGWQILALALVLIGSSAAVVVMFVLMFRIRHHVESAMQALGEVLNEGARFPGVTLFRDDGGRITVYPNRRRLILQCGLQALFVAVLGGVFAFISIGNVFMLVLLVLGAGMLVTVFLFTLYRLLIRRPTLVVGPDGILDNGSLIATGMGLLRWNEILSVTEHAMSSGGVTQRYLGILVTDARAIRKRQPLWKRIALRLISWTPWEFRIWQGMLDVPANELEAQIRRYVDTHAPPGWLPKEDDEDSVPGDREDG